jgi:hypothetical protein
MSRKIFISFCSGPTGEEKKTDAKATREIKMIARCDRFLLGKEIGSRSVGQGREVPVFLDLGPTGKNGNLEKLLILLVDLYEADSHAKGVFFCINAVQVGPNDLAGETDGLTVWRDDGHSEIFVHAQRFIASHIDPAQGNVSYLALDGAVLRFDGNRPPDITPLGSALFSMCQQIFPLQV